MKYLVFNAIAIKEDYGTSPQLGKRNSIEVVDLYLKNSLVSLSSAKINNPDIDVCLFVNFDINERFITEFQRQNVIVKKIQFNSFVLPKSYKWAMAYFKLNSLKYAIENMDYEKYMLLDTDTFTVSNYNDLWIECESGILLFDLDHRISHLYRRQIIDNMTLLYGHRENIIHYGGEFVAGGRNDLKSLIEECCLIYERMKSNNNLEDSLGDEFILSIAASKKKETIIRANRYIFRYWTRKFYLISTNYINNSVDIWHFPTEKEQGMIWMYNYFKTNNTFPDIKRCARVFGLKSATPPILHSINYVKYKLIKSRDKLESK